MDISQLLKLFRSYLDTKDISQKTKTDYLTDVKLFLKWMYEKNKGECNPELITRIMTTAYKKYMIEEMEYQPNTINRKIASIREFGEFLEKKKYVERNPGLDISIVQKQELAPESLPKVELLRLLNMVHAIGNTRDIAIISTLYNTGVRNGELAYLPIKEIELGERSGSIYIKGSKRYKSRVIPLNKEVRRDIKNYLYDRPKTIGISAEEEKEEFLLKSERGFLTTSGIYRRVKKYGDMIGIDLKPHALRHTFIRNLIDQGKDYVTISNLSGHSTTELLRIYGRPRREHLEDAVDSIEIGNIILK